MGETCQCNQTKDNPLASQVISHDPMGDPDLLSMVTWHVKLRGVGEVSDMCHFHVIMKLLQNILLNCGETKETK